MDNEVTAKITEWNKSNLSEGPISGTTFPGLVSSSRRNEGICFNDVGKCGLSLAMENTAYLAWAIERIEDAMGLSEPRLNRPIKLKKKCIFYLDQLEVPGIPPANPENGFSPLQTGRDHFGARFTFITTSPAAYCR